MPIYRACSLLRFANNYIEPLRCDHNYNRTLQLSKSDFLHFQKALSPLINDPIFRLRSIQIKHSQAMIKPA